MSNNDLVDKIQEIRTANNRNWMDLLRLALTCAPDEARAILRDILARDRAVCAEVEKILNQ